MRIDDIVRKHRFVAVATVVGVVLSVATPRLVFSMLPSGGDGLPVETTLNDFFMPGTQPDPDGVDLVPIVESMNCVLPPVPSSTLLGS